MNFLLNPTKRKPWMITSKNARIFSKMAFPLNIFKIIEYKGMEISLPLYNETGWTNVEVHRIVPRKIIITKTKGWFDLIVFASIRLI